MVHRPELAALHRLAARHRVQTAYYDNAGALRCAQPDALVAVLRALGVPLDGPLDAERALADHRRQVRRPEPIALAWGTDSARLMWPRHLPAPTACVLALEGGTEWRWRLGRQEQEDARAAGLLLPPTDRGFGPLPYGYHRLYVEGAAHHLCHVVAAPPTCHVSPTRRWGVFLPLHALATVTDHGVGSLGDLGRLAEWAGGLGASVVGTLPLLATFLDDPVDPSPYRPVSRVFWNELFLDLPTLPGLAGCPEAVSLVAAPDFVAEAARLRAADYVDYRAIARHTGRVIGLVADHVLGDVFDGGASTYRPHIERRVEQRPEIGRYAAFRAGNDAWRHSARGRFHAYAQVALDEQFSDLARPHSGAAALYADLPLGVHPDGFDVAERPELFAAGVSAGAPPDPFFAGGQDWGFPPLHPEADRCQGYSHFAAALRHSMAVADTLRIDHVMSLQRMFWVPRGIPASEGVYVRYRPAELAAVVCLESQRAGCSVVGEDLGTVTPAVRRTMARAAIAGMYVGQFAAEALSAGGDLPAPPAGALACLNTHDLVPFAGYWHGDDIASRQRHGEVSLAEASALLSARRQVCTRLAEVLGIENECAPAMEAFLGYLGDSNADLALVNLEDAWLERRPQNEPGSGPELPNWRRRAAMTFEEIEADPEIARRLGLAARAPTPQRSHTQE